MPELMTVLPALQAVLPDSFQFLHIVRDVRSVKPHKTHSMGRLAWYRSRIGGSENVTKRERFVQLWNALQLDVVNWASRNMPDRYLALQIEDLTARGPAAQHAAVRRLLGFLGVVDEASINSVVGLAERLFQGHARRYRFEVAGD